MLVSAFRYGYIELLLVTTSLVHIIKLKLDCSTVY